MAIDAGLLAQAARDVGIVLVNGFIIVALVKEDVRWLIPCYLAIVIITFEWVLKSGMV